MTYSTSALSDRRPRVAGFDAMRGLVVLLVVLFHVVLEGDGMAGVAGMYGRVLLQPLFFLSGFLSGTVSCQSGRGSGLRMLGRRWRTQLMPAAMAWMLCIGIGIIACLSGVSVWPDDMSVKWLVGEDIKSGYWFMLVLMELSVIYVAVRWCLDKVHAAADARFLAFFGLTVLGLLAGRCVDTGMVSYDLLWPLSLRSFAMFSPFFMAGAMAAVAPRRFFAVVESWWTVGITGVATVVLCGMTLYGHGLMASQWAATVFALSLFVCLDRKCSPSGRSWGMLLLLGRRSFEVYIHHLWIIEVLRLAGFWGWLVMFEMPLLPRLALYAVVAAGVTVLSLWAGALLGGGQWRRAIGVCRARILRIG